MLHTLMNSPFRCDWAAMVRLLSSGDDVLLLQDGVIAALEGNPALEVLRKASVSLFVLQDDLDARGLSGQISNAITVISYTDFVTLVVKNAQQMNW